MKYNVHIISDAEKDLFEIYDYIKKAGYQQTAETIFSKMETACRNLSFNPEKGHYPPELQRIDVYEYSEIHVKVYRIIYQIIELDVFIHCILDGRRNIPEILQRRNLR
ncbi:MAG: type II toxin-antitoxin system RelE/ParE family toxin [Desulfobacula sp.]|jgi:toxin ParE1/3/4|uniref:type II toxin-antitoxin system RelE/ParE family toxin n=1 Tax=Desulfobacula sp. TaxID=2593537 RepID=UPI001D29C49A|nr:type II toxin-antitoxin system RelE/ParE family toxin [Desulfobacula sp.]MBT3804498.1 type II toxin-antitoxin system RelE/ParE family toxin [Desulfobacula sp.]MBT4024908.1 type II toxin-antitoxin system RelE/ParE family toxin [Desulfobacula sp.]MBT4198860.1 type II toxin-antitoxin system RelE/ParE family toxin [Desulfobacula sp.]MBT4508076.1 type II toxin-antitoxin system RelE/ParE family toxin [Desulfobacula sp.]